MLCYYALSGLCWLQNSIHQIIQKPYKAYNQTIQQPNNSTIKQFNNQTIQNQTIQQSNNQTIKQFNNQTITI